MKPWRDAVKAEQASIKANADFLPKALHDDPALAASNPVSRYLQRSVSSGTMLNRYARLKNGEEYLAISPKCRQAHAGGGEENRGIHQKA